MELKYWLFKSEPDEFGIDDLAARKRQTARWDGIRNYQARNNLRDGVKKGDLVLFYHSSCRDTGVAGYMQVVSEPYPDPAQFDPDSRYYDRRSSRDAPRWYSVDVRLAEKFSRVIATKELRDNRVTAGLAIFRQSRLSVAPVTPDQWEAVLALR